MGLLTASELAELQADAEYDTTCVVKRYQGGSLQTLAGYEAVPCRFAPMAIMPQLDTSGTQRLVLDDRYIFALPATKPVQFGDQLVVGSRTFEVVQAPQASTQVETIAICQEKGR